MKGQELKEQHYQSKVLPPQARKDIGACRVSKNYKINRAKSQKVTMKEELQKIYDSEINIQISNFWDAGWKVAVMKQGKWVYPTWDFCELEEVVPALQELIKEHFPESTYAKSL